MFKIHIMKNTTENKQKYFAQYWGQQVLCWSGKNSSHKYLMIGAHSLSDLMDNENLKTFIELTPLSEITDEDARNLGFRDSDHFKIDGNEYGRKDELRLMGYAVEWCRLEVEELINRGWLKLKKK